jgi:LacI family transcriptional regulator
MEESAPARAATIYDVARLAGVSHQTVSRLIKGQRLSDRSRKVVENAIEQLNFRPNSAARALATRRSSRIGALVFEMAQHGPMMLLTSATSAARAAGYVLDIVTLDPFDAKSTREAIELINHNGLDGILALAPNDSVRFALERTVFSVPVYFENETDSDAQPGNLSYDAGVLVAEHLLGLGHRSIAHISGPLDWPAARLRMAGFNTALNTRGLSMLASVEGDWSAGSGFRGMNELLKRADRATAVFASNDEMAIGAIAAITQSGLRVPDDISVAGVDDNAEAPYIMPPLTTVPMRFADQGSHLFEVLLARIDGKDLPARDGAFTTELIVRGSTSRAAH